MKPGVVPIISNDYNDQDVFHPAVLHGTTLGRDDEGRDAAH